MIKSGDTVIRKWDAAIGHVLDIDGETGLIVVQWSSPGSENTKRTHEDPLDLVLATLFERVRRRFRLYVFGT